MNIEDVRRIAEKLQDGYSTDSLSVGVLIHEDPAGTFHVTCQGGSYERDDMTRLARLGKSALDAFARGKTAFVRVQPELTHEKDLLCGKYFICSYVRFSFLDEPGEWMIRAETPDPSYFGLTKA